VQRFIIRGQFQRLVEMIEWHQDHVAAAGKYRRATSVFQAQKVTRLSAGSIKPQQRQDAPDEDKRVPGASCR
jgi:hypothetical protein